MLKMLEKFEEMARQATTVSMADPAKFNDPLALKTDWGPKSPGGSSHKTHLLRKVDSQRLEFRPSKGMLIFTLLFLGIGLVAIGTGVAGAMKGSAVFSERVILPVLFGVMFALAGGAMYWFAMTPIVFDLGHGYYWRNRKRPDRVIDPSRLKNCAPLARIHALQIIPERVTSSKSKGGSTSYISYELNLVLDDGSRLNVVDHAHIDSLRGEAGELAGFLGKPVWDATLAV